MKPGDTAYILFSISDGTADADALPTAKVNRTGATIDPATVPVTVAHVETGIYSASWLIPGGWNAGDYVSLIVYATIAGIPQKLPKGPWTLDRRVGDISNAAGVVNTHELIGSFAVSDATPGVGSFITNVGAIDVTGALLIFRSGALNGQRFMVTQYSISTQRITLAAIPGGNALSAAPANTDTFDLLVADPAIIRSISINP